jgi:hypothetical protein
MYHPSFPFPWMYILHDGFAQQDIPQDTDTGDYEEGQASPMKKEANINPLARKPLWL